MRTTAKVVGGTMIFLGSMFITACGGGPTGADPVPGLDAETTANGYRGAGSSGKTDAGIRVVGGSTDLYTKIDQSLVEVENCWNQTEDAGKLTVNVVEPELTDKAGQGVIRVNGTLVYGMRSGNRIWVATDLAALKHEFSHVVGQHATGKLANDGDGKCWL